MTAAHRSFAALLVSMLVLLGLSACGSKSEPPQEPAAAEDKAYGDMVRTMDKARAVEETTMQHKEDLDRAVDAAENSR
jgi:hypothetical protein